MKGFSEQHMAALLYAVVISMLMGGMATIAWLMRSVGPVASGAGS